MNVLTSTAVFAFGTYDISVKQSDPSLLPPIVPIPVVVVPTPAIENKAVVMPAL